MGKRSMSLSSPRRYSLCLRSHRLRPVLEKLVAVFVSAGTARWSIWVVLLGLLAQTRGSNRGRIAQRPASRYSIYFTLLNALQRRSEITPNGPPVGRGVSVQPIE